jgi:hypothetical protein
MSIGYGFHEDGVRSGVDVALQITGEPPSWVQKYGSQRMVAAPKKELASLQKQWNPISSMWFNLFLKPITSTISAFFKKFVVDFLRKGIVKGQLKFLSSDDGK